MRSKHRILVLDDEPNIVEVLITRLEVLGFPVQGCTSAQKALDILRKEEFSLLITDMKMPDMDGMEVLRKVKKIDPDLEVIIFTAYGSIEGAVRAIQQGAHDYLVKPFEPVELVVKIESALEKRELKQRVKYLEQEVEDRLDHRIYAQSSAMKRVLSLVRQVSQSDATILILGESGTGKELIAKMLHYESTRRHAKFVIVDCGATPSSLIEAELFGYRRGAFTGAVKDKRGIIEEANSGTLFLDEIGNISAEMQTRLLRVLESGEFRPLGDIGQKKADIRVLTATNVDLKKKVDQGLFREDLYYRLKVITIQLPPLRERKEDIIGLSQIFLTEFSSKTGKRIEGIDREAMDLLLSYHWPGNVRELKNIMEAAVVLCTTGTITPEEILSSGIFERTGNVPHQELNILDTQEKELLLQALKKARWVQKDAAQQLGISRRVMHYKIKKFNLRPERSD